VRWRFFLLVSRSEETEDEVIEGTTVEVMAWGAEIVVTIGLNVKNEASVPRAELRLEVLFMGTTLANGTEEEDADEDREDIDDAVDDKDDKLGEIDTEREE